LRGYTVRGKDGNCKNGKKIIPLMYRTIKPGRVGNFFISVNRVSIKTDLTKPKVYINFVVTSETKKNYFYKNKVI